MWTQGRLTEVIEKLNEKHKEEPLSQKKIHFEKKTIIKILDVDSPEMQNCAGLSEM